jgi:hypothetical protein
VRRQSYKNRSSYKGTTVREFYAADLHEELLQLSIGVRMTMAVRLLKLTNPSNDCSKSQKKHLLKQKRLFQVKQVGFYTTQIMTRSLTYR